ncbi:MAG: hypothetical protein KIS67_27510 [Verrucomicrobiae bacterium]|nr:hypothetical protein [Verrucomicrobiae bacterium]
MKQREHNKTDGWSFPPDLGALLSPILLIIAILYLSSGLFWAKTTGDTSLFHLALFLGSAGALLLLVARIPLYRQRRFFTLGPGALTGIYRKLYYAAYALIVPSILFFGLLLYSLR